MAVELNETERALVNLYKGDSNISQNEDSTEMDVDSPENSLNDKDDSLESRLSQSNIEKASGEEKDSGSNNEPEEKPVSSPQGSTSSSSKKSIKSSLSNEEKVSKDVEMNELEDEMETNSNASGECNSNKLDTSNFCEAPNGPVSPEASEVNPLDSDRDDTTRDSITNNNGEKASESCATDGDTPESSSPPKEGSNGKDDGSKPSEDNEPEAGSAEPEKDDATDLSEVITSDKTHSDAGKKPKAVIRIAKAKAKNEKPVNTTANEVDGHSQTTYKVIYPKKQSESKAKVTHHNEHEVANCLQCSKGAKCTISIEIGGVRHYFCSDECLKQNLVLQEKAIERKTTPVVRTPEHKDFGVELRLCLNCDANVTALPEDKILSWEAMEFCNEDCLSKYQAKMWSFCNACQKEVPTPCMGKYCVRFGHEVKQFCSSSCLDEFKKCIKVCSYCQKDISNSQESFLAPIGDSGNFKDFCSQFCLDELYCMSNNVPAGVLRVENCSVCDQLKLVQIQVVTSDGVKSLCSEICFSAFRFVNTAISPIPCAVCKKFFDTKSNIVSVYYENELLSFCSKSCMDIHVLSKRKIVSCAWCKVKKYNFDMVRRNTSTGHLEWCSVNCMALYQVSTSVISSNTKKPCTQCKRVDVLNFHLTMSDATMRNFCSMDCVNTFQGSFSSGSHNGVVPTGTPKVVLPKGVLSPKDPKAVSPGAKSVPVIESVGTLKKPSELKVISQASMNGIMFPSSTNSSSPSATQQLIKQRILCIPQAVPEKRNVKIQVKPTTSIKSVTVRVNTAFKAIQAADPTETDEKCLEKILVPIPVPIYVPCPMAMYSIPVPTPVPVPIPIPVPIFIPTTKNSAEEIMAEIKRIQEEMPGDPYEAELIMMAERAEGRKRSSQDESSTSLDETSKNKKRRADDSIDRVDEPSDKRRRIDVTSNDSLDATANHFVSSRAPMSLKDSLGMNAWKYYASEHGEKTDLFSMRPGELAQSLKGFIKKAKAPNGSEYTPDQKYYLSLGIQYNLLELDKPDNIYFDTLFEPFIAALDEEAVKFQELFSEGGDIVTRVEEEHLWEAKQLGPDNPSSLLAALIYFNTKYFNLTTVEEHMQLTFRDISKRITGGLSENSAVCPSSELVLRYVTPQDILEIYPEKRRIYEVESLSNNPYRCPINLFEFYLSKCPESVKLKNDRFYLSPEISSVGDSPIWYTTTRLSEDVVRRTLNRFKMVKEINLAILGTSTEV